MMKKIIVLTNGISAPWHIITFALNIARQSNAEVYALFLKDERRNNPYPSDMESTETNLYGKKAEVENEELEEKNIAVFKTFCDNEKVKCHVEKNISLEQLIDSSSGADLIVADLRDDLQRYSLKDILAGVNCPVCLISVNATEIKKTILLYDGSEDALHAITTYSILFPKLCKEKSYLVTINANKKVKKMDLKAIMQKLEQKFSNLQMVSLSGNLDKKLIEFLDEHTENTMVVMGAYGRSAISRLFNPSLSNIILEQSRTSLFIAHD
jgi:nucleotide-binding universal stress UspA family protein